MAGAGLFDPNSRERARLEPGMFFIRAGSAESQTQFDTSRCSLSAGAVREFWILKRENRDFSTFVQKGFSVFFANSAQVASLQLLTTSNYFQLFFQSDTWCPSDFANMSAFKSSGLNGEEITAGGT
jgi:hypothetical protein